MIDFDPRETLNAVVRQGRMEAAQRDIEVVSWMDPELPSGLLGDEARLRRALHLLVGHAVNATVAGTVGISIRIESRTADTARLVFEVTDSAPGLIADPDAGFPIAGDITREEHVDLALWRQMVQLLADELGVKSGVESGNAIWFTVEFEVTGSAATPKSAGECRVLVVEDNLVNQKVAMRMIQKLGYSVDVVADGRAAVDALEKEPYDLVLMDCQMPVMDGYEATEEIRRREGDQKHTPIVALTAHAVASNRQRCLEIGMDDFVTKPVTTDQLRRVLENWINPTPVTTG